MTQDTVRIELRCSHATKKRLSKEADRAGMALSVWARERLLSDSPEPEEPARSLPRRSNETRFEVRCTPKERDQLYRRAKAAGFVGRGFRVWALARLMGLSPRVERPATKLLSVLEAAEYVGVSRQQFYIWIKTGRVQSWDLPEGLRVAERDLVPAA